MVSPILGSRHWGLTVFWSCDGKAICISCEILSFISLIVLSRLTRSLVYRPRAVQNFLINGNVHLVLAPIVKCLSIKYVSIGQNVNKWEAMCKEALWKSFKVSNNYNGIVEIYFAFCKKVANGKRKVSAWCGKHMVKERYLSCVATLWPFPLPKSNWICLIFPSLMAQGLQPKMDES